MRVCFTSDLHGSESLYAQLAELVRRERPALLILGGDLFPDGELDDPDATQGRYVRDQFASWIAAQRRELPGLRVACILGNHDWTCSEAALEAAHQRGDLALLDHRRTWNVNGFAFLGYSRTPPSPFWVKDFERLDRSGDAVPETGGVVWDGAARRVREVTPQAHFGAQPTIADDLSRVDGAPAPWVFVCHGPPFDSKLDRLPHIADPLGSHAIRDFIIRSRPLCSLHGHFHESPDVTGAFTTRIGETLSINPGQHRDELSAVVFELPNVAETIRHTLRGR